MVLKAGQHVHLKFHPEAWGTVSKIEPGRFCVTWHTPNHGQRDPNTHRRVSRMRMWYDHDALLTGLVLGPAHFSAED